MTSYLAIRISHSLPAVLLMLGIIAHIITIRRAGNKGHERLQLKLQRTHRITLPLFTLVALSLPISGWWLVHLSGMPMSLFWLQLSIILLPLIFVCFGLLHLSLGKWLQNLAAQKQEGEKVQAKKTPQWLSLAWAVICLIVLLVISALMGVKPLY